MTRKHGNGPARRSARLPRHLANRARTKKLSADDIVGAQLLGTSAVGEIDDLTRNTAQPLGVGALDDGCEQTLEVEIDGDRDVDVVVDDERALTDGRIHVREFAQRVAQRAHDERKVGEAEALCFLPRLSMRSTNPLDAFVVDLDCGEHMR